MKRLRFWQKIYLAALAVFLIALNGGLGIAGLGCYSILMESEIDSALEDQRLLAQGLARDLQASGADAKPFQVKTLAAAYASQFDGLVRVELDGQSVYATPGYDASDKSVHAETGTQHWEFETFANGGRYILVGGGLSSDETSLQVTFAHSLRGFEDEWGEIVTRLLAASAGISAVGAVGLYLALRRLSTPLERLAGTADAYAAGERTARAEVRGHDEVAALATSFNNLADSVDETIDGLEQAAEANARMAASLSHEVRTPLTAIRGYAEYLMIANASPEERAEAADYVIHQAERLHRISERMLQLFAVERAPLTLAPVNMAAVVSAAVATVEPKARAAGIALEAASAAAPCWVEGDAVLLESLAVNLIDNAVAASTPGGTVRITLKPADTPEEPAVLLAVSDKGRGLSAGELERLGEPFYRPDKARSRARGGAGLGVALVRRIAAAHGAHVSYASAPGRGTEAAVAFPACVDAVDAPVTSRCDDGLDDAPRKEG